jgi:hypothetical protein
MMMEDDAVEVSWRSEYDAVWKDELVEIRGALSSSSEF